MSPPARAWPALAYDATRARTVLFGGSPLWAPGQFGDTWEWDGSNWTLVAASAPIMPRSRATMTFNSARSRCVLFGGYGSPIPGPTDTWEWDGQTWTQVPTTSPVPRPRVEGGLAYDTLRGVLVLFGGEDRTVVQGLLNDTWELRGTQWTDVSPRTGSVPSARMPGTLLFDPLRLRTLLIGGWTQLTNSVAYPRDQWEWDGQTWTLVAPSAPHAAPLDLRDRAGAVAACDPSGQRMLAIGGVTGAQAEKRLGDTWIRDAGRWRASAAQRVAPAVSGAAGAYDPNRQRFVVFGGGYDQSSDEHWEWDGMAWTSNPAARPPARTGAAMTYDVGRGCLVLFGGRFNSPTGGPVFGDTWECSNGSTWIQRMVPGPQVRVDSAMTYAHAWGKVLLYSGAGPYNDLWSWDGVAWRYAATSNQDPPFGQAGMAFDERRQRVVVFRCYSSSRLRETWEHDGRSWARGPDGPAFPGLNIRMVYDPERATVLAAGSTNSGVEVWEYDGANWSRLVSGAYPVGLRDNFVFAYDSHRRQHVLYGGNEVALNTTFVSHPAGALWTLAPRTATVPLREVPLGQIARVNLTGPLTPQLYYLLGLSQATAPTIPVVLTGNATPVAWPIAPDRLFQITLGMPGLVGALDQNGLAQASFPIPNDPTLEGLRIFASALLFDGGAQLYDTTHETEILAVR